MNFNDFGIIVRPAGQLIVPASTSTSHLMPEWPGFASVTAGHAITWPAESRPARVMLRPRCSGWMIDGLLDLHASSYKKIQLCCSLK